MTAELERQYRPVSSAETAGDDALSVRAVRELADAINNYKAQMAGPILQLINGQIGASYPPYDCWPSVDNDTDEQVIFVCSRPLAAAYNRIIFQIGGEMAAASSGETTWKLYSSSRLYVGPQLFDSSYLGNAWDASTGITIDSTTHQCPAGVSDLVAVRDAAGDTHLTLTAQNDTAAAGEYCTLSAATATPKVVLL